MSEQDVEVVRGGYDAFNSGNAEGVIERLDENVEWIEPGGGNAPAGTFKGPDAVRTEVMESVPKNFDEFACVPEEFKDEGDRVVVQAHFTGKNKSGAELDAHAEQIYELSGGKIVRLENKPDPEAWAAGWS